MDNRIDYINARDVYVVDNSTYFRAAEPDPVRAGFLSLHQCRYADAVRRFTAAIAADPDDQRLQFGLALALLQGRRPHQHSRQTLSDVRECAAAAPDLPEAAVVRELVAEDERLAWRRRPVRADLSALVDPVGEGAAALILRHAKAPGAPVYQALESAYGRRVAQ